MSNLQPIFILLQSHWQALMSRCWCRTVKMTDQQSYELSVTLSRHSAPARNPSWWSYAFLPSSAASHWQNTQSSQHCLPVCASSQHNHLQSLLKVMQRKLYHRCGNDFFGWGSKNWTTFRLGKQKLVKNNQIQSITLCNMYFSQNLYTVYNGVWGKAQKLGIVENFCVKCNLTDLTLHSVRLLLTVSCRKNWGSRMH